MTYEELQDLIVEDEVAAWQMFLDIVEKKHLWANAFGVFNSKYKECNL